MTACSALFNPPYINFHREGPRSGFEFESRGKVFVIISALTTLLGSQDFMNTKMKG